MQISAIIVHFAGFLQKHYNKTQGGRAAFLTCLHLQGIYVSALKIYTEVYAGTTIKNPKTEQWRNLSDS